MIQIDNCKCLTDSELKRQNHWVVKMLNKDRVRDKVFSEAIKHNGMTGKTVNVMIEAKFTKDNSVNACNLYINPIISGLIKARLLESEDIEWISIKTVSSSPSDKIIIYINENK